MKGKSPSGIRRTGRFCVGLRCKTVIILTATVFAAATSVGFAARLFILGSIDRIESREAAEALGRAWAIVKDDMEQLDVLVKDWAAWDDTWDFMRTRDPEFVGKNLALDGLLEGLGISALLMLDTGGRAAYSAADDDRWITGLAESYRKARPSSGTGWTRLAASGGSLHVSAARPILRSDGTGEWRGTFIMSKAVDDELLKRYSRLSGLAVALEAASEDARAAGAGARVEPRMIEGLPGPAWISIKDGVVEARALIPLPGSPLGAEISVSMDRELERRNRIPSILFLSAAIIAIVAVGMTAILLFEAAILGRMRAMGSELESIAGKGGAELRLTVSGNDELTALVRSVNATLDRFHSLLTERDAAIREIHHRVKNNLQVISSLVSLQAGKADQRESGALSDIRRRVLAIAFVHEELYLDREIERVEAERLFSRLASMVADSYDEGPRIRIDIDCGRFSLDLELAVPIGLVFCEIVANSFRHAFAETSSGAISVRARADEDGTLRLSIDDDGIGIAPGAGRGLGLNLVETLSKQIQAIYEIRPRAGGGTSFLIAVPGAVSA